MTAKTMTGPCHLACLFYDVNADMYSHSDDDSSNDE